jgi:hypothetical protein
VIKQKIEFHNAIWSLILVQQHRVWVSENEMLRRTEKVLDEGVTLHDQGLHGNKIKMMK